MKSFKLVVAFAAVLAIVRPARADDVCSKPIQDLRAEAKGDCDDLQSTNKHQLGLPATDKVGIDADNAHMQALREGNPLVRISLCSARIDSCRDLASALAAGIDVASLDALKQQNDAAGKAVAQSDRQTANNKSGSAAQIDPVEAIQPITLAGGAIALAGTRSGTKGVGTMTINPLALAAPDDAVAGRMLDLTVSAPFDLSRGTGQNTQYISSRLRVNFTAPISAGPLQQRLTAWMKAAGNTADAIEDILAKAPDVKGCAKYIAANHKVTKDACGQDLDDAALDAARSAAFAELEAARRAADKYYFGLDVRFDTGDPTGTQIAGDKGTHILGGLAGGVRLEQSPRWDWELRGRAAGDYFDSRDTVGGARPDPVYSFDWGAAFIFSGRLKEQAKQRLAVGAGLEGRQSIGSRANADKTPTNFTNLNLMVVVPAVSGGDIGLGLSIPLIEKGVPRGTIISLSTDLGLLDHSTN